MMTLIIMTLMIMATVYDIDNRYHIEVIESRTFLVTPLMTPLITPLMTPLKSTSALP